jgi:UTP-glucose-1-phosphate uridylyltransferase
MVKYIKAVVDLALESEEYGAELTEFLKQRLS